MSLQKILSNYYKIYLAYYSIVIYSFNKGPSSFDFGVVDIKMREKHDYALQDHNLYVSVGEKRVFVFDCLRYYFRYLCPDYMLHIEHIKTSSFLYRHQTSIGILNDFEEIKELKKTYKLSPREEKLMFQVLFKNYEQQMLKKQKPQKDEDIEEGDYVYDNDY